MCDCTSSGDNFGGTWPPVQPCPQCSVVSGGLSSRINAHNLIRKSSCNVATSWRPALSGASPQKNQFTWCFISVFDGRDRYFLGAYFQLPCSELCLTWSSYSSACKFCGIVHCWCSMLPQHRCLNTAASTLHPSSNQLNRREFGSNPSSLNLLRCPARIP